MLRRLLSAHGLRGLLFVSAFAFAFFFPQLRSWANGRITPVTQLCLAVAGGALLCTAWVLVDRRLRGATPTAAPMSARPRADWLLAGGVALLFCLSAARFVEHFPAAIDSEASEGLRFALGAVDAAESGRSREYWQHQLPRYNLGLGPILIPLAGWFGANQAVYKWANVVYFALILGLLAAAFSRWSLAGRDRWLILPLPFVAYLLPCQQIYQWQAVSLAGCLALLASANAWSAGCARYAGRLLLFPLAVVLYHGQLIFLASVVAFALWQLVSPPDGLRRWGRTAAWLGSGALALGVHVLAAGGAFLSAGNRAVEETKNWDALLRPAELASHAQAILEMPERLLSWPVFALALLGLAATAAQADRGSSVDRLALLLFANGLAVHLAVQRPIIPAWHCWYLLPALWLLLQGIAASLPRLCARLGARAGTGLALICLASVAWLEWRFYLERALYFYPHPVPVQANSTDALDRLFRHFSRLPADSPPTLHLIPELGIPQDRGGFVRETSFEHSDWRGHRVAVRTFADAAELQCWIRGVREGRVRFPRLVVYLSQSGDEAEWNAERLQPALAGLPYEYGVLELQGAPLPKSHRCLALTFERGR